jgi:hypothetical protein
MVCDPKKVPYLQMLNDIGLGNNDPGDITVAGKQVSEVRENLTGSDACD